MRTPTSLALCLGIVILNSWCIPVFAQMASSSKSESDLTVPQAPLSHDTSLSFGSSPLATSSDQSFPATKLSGEPFDRSERPHNLDRTFAAAPFELKLLFSASNAEASTRVPDRLSLDVPARLIPSIFDNPNAGSISSGCATPPIDSPSHRPPDRLRGPDLADLAELPDFTPIGLPGFASQLNDEEPPTSPAAEPTSPIKLPRALAKINLGELWQNEPDSRPTESWSSERKPDSPGTRFLPATGMGGTHIWFASSPWSNDGVEHEPLDFSNPPGGRSIDEFEVIDLPGHKDGDPLIIVRVHWRF